MEGRIVGVLFDSYNRKWVFARTACVFSFATPAAESVLFSLLP
jgi:hypothetical protein